MSETELRLKKFILFVTVEKAVAAINSALGGDSEDLILQTLQNEALDLSDVHPANVSYYQRGLVGKKMAKAIAHLAEEEIQDCIKEINDLADMDRLGEWLLKIMKCSRCT